MRRSSAIKGCSLINLPAMRLLFSRRPLRDSNASTKHKHDPSLSYVCIFWYDNWEVTLGHADILVCMSDMLAMCMQEVLRMYPPVGIGQLRQAQQDVSLAGKLSIPKGTVVWIPHYGMHNARHNWEAPEKFDPGLHQTPAWQTSCCKSPNSRLTSCKWNCYKDGKQGCGAWHQMVVSSVALMVMSCTHIPKASALRSTVLRTS